MNPHSEDSDSAPEDVAFQDAKDDALAHLKTVSQAALQKKKLRKEVIKKRQEKLTEQKEAKRRKLADLESKKLPSSVLEDLDGAEETIKSISDLQSELLKARYNLLKNATFIIFLPR